MTRHSTNADRGGARPAPRLVALTGLTEALINRSDRTRQTAGKAMSGNIAMSNIPVAFERLNRRLATERALRRLRAAAPWIVAAGLLVWGLAW